MKTIAAFVFVALTALAGAAFAGECPVKQFGENYVEEVVTQVGAATSCYSAATIATDCGMGSSMDGPITAAAVTVCEADFSKKLKTSEAKTYRSLVEKCTKKYAKMSGTMYLSAAAFCRLDVARLYSELYTPAE